MVSDIWGHIQEMGFDRMLYLCTSFVIAKYDVANLFNLHSNDHKQP